MSPEGRPRGLPSQKESETFNRKGSVDTIYLVDPVSKNNKAKRTGLFSARIPTKGTLKQKAMKSVKLADN